ncbi:DNA break repair nuclease [Mortierella sp. AM989]|nr:DNA break repair nuclease [Mortierella sp. AM989]
MDRNQRKHDLIDESHTSIKHNVREQLNPRKKRAISLRRPRICDSPDSFSDPSSGTSDHSSDIPTTTTSTVSASVSFSSTTIAAVRSTGAATASVSVSVIQQKTTQDAQNPEYTKDSETQLAAAKSSEHQERLPAPNWEDKNERSVQESGDTETQGINNAFFKEEKERSHETTDARIITKDTPGTEQADGRVSECHASPSALKVADQNQAEAAEEPDDFAGCPQILLDPCSNPTRNGEIDIDEGLDKDTECGEFEDIDEIQDWDISDLKQDDGQSHQNVSPVPENTCPLCGLDLSSLDTMTPDAHVNRCLDGTASEPAIVAPELLVRSTEVATAATVVQASSGSSLTAIIGTIRSTVTKFTTRSGNNNITSTPKQTQGNKSNRQFKPKTPKPCPFYKKMPGNFTVDAFCYGAVDGCDAYFLSHFHSDHYGGLTSSWNHGLIYCSSITANLVTSRLNVDCKFVKRLPMYEPTVINGVTVRLMDANHCPGSVLFVFDLENPRRRYLHTGDFRACPEMVLDPILRQPPNVPIDILYLDTTYSNPRYTFPSQDLVIKEAANLVCREVGIHNNQLPVSTSVVQAPKKVNIMEKWLKKESGNNEKLISMSIKSAQSIKAKQKWKDPAEKNKIVICVGTYLIGKERVFTAIAKAINSKVYVQHSKLQILSCLEDPELLDMLTSNRFEAQVHLVHMGSEMSPESLQDYLDSLSPTFTRLIAIRPTGWTFTGGSKKYTSADEGLTMNDQNQSIPTTPTMLELRPSFTSSTVKIYPVPYSEHSSFNELAGFVRSLNIAKVIPTVGMGNEKGRHAMNEWFRKWENERRQDEEMSTTGSISGGSNWDETMEMSLFYAATKFKPVGMHKHFRMINLQKQFNKNSHTPCTIAELWEKLGTMYDLQTLDEREDSGMLVDEDEEEEEEDDEERDISFKNSEEFVLPLHEFDHLVKDVAQEPSRNPSPSPMRTTRAHREGSQTPSVADSSRASSPDGEDAPKKRRTSRSTKKSDVNETPSPRTSSTATASSTRRTTRAKAEPAPVTRGRKTGKKVDMLNNQARETVSRMFEEMGKTLNGVGDYPESEYETDSEDESKDPSKATPTRIHPSSSAGEAPVEEKKKKKKKKKKKSNKIDIEDLFTSSDPLEPEDIYDISKSAAERVEIAVTKFRKNRKFSNERVHILTTYLEYGGIKSGPKSFQGGAVGGHGDDDDGEPDFEAMNAGIDRVDLPEDGQEVDFTNVVTTFLSEYFLKNTGWIDMAYYKDTPLVIAALLNYFLVRNVLPEYEQDIRNALAVAEQAKIELPLCKLISNGWPSKYDKACSLLYGGEWYGFLDDSWQDIQVLVDTMGMDRLTAERIVQSLIGPDVDLKSLTVSPREFMDLEVIKIEMPKIESDTEDGPDSQTESPAEDDAELVAMVDKMLLGSQGQGNSIAEPLQVPEGILGSVNSIEQGAKEILMPVPVFADITFAEWDSGQPRDQQKPMDQRRKVHVYFDPTIASKILPGMRVVAYVYTLSNGMSYLQQASIYPTYYLEADEVEVPWDEWED